MGHLSSEAAIVAAALPASWCADFLHAQPLRSLRRAHNAWLAGGVSARRSAPEGVLERGASGRSRIGAGPYCMEARTAAHSPPLVRCVHSSPLSRSYPTGARGAGPASASDLGPS